MHFPLYDISLNIFGHENHLSFRVRDLHITWPPMKRGVLYACVMTHTPAGLHVRHWDATK